MPDKKTQREQADSQRNRDNGGTSRAGYDYTQSQGYKDEMRRRRGE